MHFLSCCRAVVLSCYTKSSHRINTVFCANGLSWQKVVPISIVTKRIPYNRISLIDKNHACRRDNVAEYGRSNSTCTSGDKSRVCLSATDEQIIGIMTTL